MVSELSVSAVDVGQNSQIEERNMTAQIDAVSGAVIAAPLANKRVWAGFPSVNQVDPNLVSFAGQFIGNSTITIKTSTILGTNRSRTPPEVMPMDRATRPVPVS